ncbi:hypothetical protein [Methylobacterium sp. CCH5-D2]|uniref:hypothetical protein n=1 Tax=Methylobacterium sp. CCH5-D2 TaxID=1768765 RepID=UPI00082D5DAD|nr:hypothetical protein [Methylobacterium sp. CCH5-D2]
MTVTAKGPGLAGVLKNVRALTRTDVLVGVPAEKAERPSEPGETGERPNNAALAYIHDTGMPEQNIPARPFMAPGIAEGEGAITKAYALAGQQALIGDEAGMIRAQHMAGLAAQNAIRGKINEGIAPPLSERTLRARAARGRKGAIKELKARAKGEAPTLTNAKPLIDTGQLRNSITYVIRPRGE